MRTHALRFSLAFVAMNVAVPALADPIPVGLPFQINTYTRREAFTPYIATAADGSFVAIFGSIGLAGGGATDTDGTAVLARRFDVFAGPRDTPFQVNSFTTGGQYAALGAVAADDSFIVAWSSARDGSESSAASQVFDPAATPLGPELQVNEYTSQRQFSNDVIATTDGNFLVVMHSNAPADGSGAAVLGRIVDGSSGAAIGGEFVVNSYTTSSQYHASIARSGSGFVASWTDARDGVTKIFGRRISGSGIPTGADFQISSGTPSADFLSRVAGDSSGGFLAVWTRQSGASWDVFARRYDASNLPVGTEFQVNTDTDGDQFPMNIVTRADDSFVVVWGNPEINPVRIGAQRIDSSGLPVGPELTIDPSPHAMSVYDAHVAEGANGGLTVAWTATERVYVQRYACDDPGPDADGDSISDPCDPCPGMAADDDVDADCVEDVFDNCPNVSNSDQADDDGDLLGDPCDFCPLPTDSDADGTQDCVDDCVNVAGAQDFALRAKLRFKFVNTNPTLGDDRFSLRGEGMLPPGFDFSMLDPVTAVVKVTVPGDNELPAVDFVDELVAGTWTRTPNSWKYRPDSTFVSDVSKIVIKDMSKRAPGLVKVTAAGRNGHFPVEPDDFPLLARVVLGDGTAQCFETAFEAGDCGSSALDSTLTCER
jgi:hypothetical protein